VGTDVKAIAPGAIETYSGQLNAGIDQITNGLNDICAAITNVNYGGKNAYAFKTEAGRLANSLSAKIYEALSTLARNVSQATSDLSGSLGGSAITISLTNNTITPADAGADTEDGIASVSGLQALARAVNAGFSTIKTGIGKVADLPPNSPQGWMGDRRNATESVVMEFVGMANSNCTTTESSLTDYITSQINAVESQ